MARIDPLVAALMSHKGDELYFRTGSGLTVRVGDQSRQVMHKPLTQQQVDAVMREIMPPTQPLPPLEGGAVIFQYRAPAGMVQVTFERFRSHSVVSVTPALESPTASGLETLPETAAPAPAAATIQEYGLPQLLGLALEQGATDIHLRPGLSPIFRLGGELVVLRTHPAIDSGYIERELLVHAPPGAKAAYDEQHGYEFHHVTDRAAMRVTLVQDRQHLVAVLRLAPLQLPPVESLGFWEHGRGLFDQPRGLILVGGMSGSGRSTTLASVIEFYGRTRTQHTLMVSTEAPHSIAPVKGFVTQRVVGRQVETALTALQQALHSDVDAVVISAVGSADEWRATLALAETGKLVLAGLQAPTAVSAVMEVLSHFPPFEQPAIGARLARVFAGATAQFLIPRRPKGRVAVLETLVSVPAVRQAIAKARFEELAPLQEATRDAGSVSFDDALVSLVSSGQADEDQALRFVTAPADFFARLQPPDNHTPATQVTEEMPGGKAFG